MSILTDAEEERDCKADLSNWLQGQVSVDSVLIKSNTSQKNKK